MGYLNNSVVTVDAILTTKGRELLAKGDGSFKITQFALGDDEIDYTLYNPTHPSGSAYYGQAIENMPLLEAFPQETQIMKYMLVTLPRGTAKMPILDLGYAAITLKQGASISITPQTLNYLGEGQLYETSGYTVTIGDSRVLKQITATGTSNTPGLAPLAPTRQLDPNSQNISTRALEYNPTSPQTKSKLSSTKGTNVSETVVGTSITIQATTVNTLFGSNNALYTTLTVTGRDSGARITIPVTIKKVG